MMDAPKVQSIADAIYNAPRFDLHWHLVNAIDRTWAQVIYMGLMCVERQLTLGGTIDVTADANQIKITADQPLPTLGGNGLPPI